MSELMRHVVVVVWPGLGLGSERDQANGSQIERVAAYVGGLNVPTLSWLGLGNVSPIRGLDPADPPAASFGRLVLPADLEGLVGEAAREILEAGHEVHLVGGAAARLSVEGAVAHPGGIKGTVGQVADLATLSPSGLIVAIPEPRECPSSDSPVTAARAYQRLDQEVARLLDLLEGREDVMVLLTSDGSQSVSTEASGRATVAGSSPADQPKWAPVLAHFGALPSGIAFGDRTPGDFGATAADALGASASMGKSFLAEMLA